MNHHPRDIRLPLTTQAAEGLPRRRWTVVEIEEMVDRGIIDEHERFELIGGEIVPMSPKGARHEMVKIELNRHFQRAIADGLSIAQETTLRLDADAYVEPDFCVFPRHLVANLRTLDGSAVLLAVEVADSSLAYDLGRKIGVYAAYGVREVWVINANTLVTRIHAGLAGATYATVRNLGPRSTLTPKLVPELAVSLAALGLKPLKGA